MPSCPTFDTNTDTKDPSASRSVPWPSKGLSTQTLEHLADLHAECGVTWILAVKGVWWWSKNPSAVVPPNP